MIDKRYTANITAGALLVPESRIVAALLLKDIDNKGWKEAIETKNVLQKRSLSTAKRLSSLIRVRLKAMKPELWALIKDGNARVATHAVFASAIKHCHLLGDYLDLVVREQFLRMERKLSLIGWDEYVQQCRQRDPNMPEFPPTTARKIRSNVHKVLVEAGYLKDVRSLVLQRIDIAPEVIRYLRQYQENYVLRCIQA